MNKLLHASKSNPCPICTKTDWCYELSDTLWCCKRSDSAPADWIRTTKQDSDGAWYFAIENDNNGDRAAKQEEWERLKAEREANQRQVQHQEFKTQLTAAQRDPLIRALSQELGLSGQHRQMIRERGLTDERIKAGLFFSIEPWQEVSNRYPLNLPGIKQTKDGKRFVATTKDESTGKYVGGIAIVTLDVSGLATGWQLMTVPRIEDKKYIWALGEKSSHLPLGNGELPIQVVGIAIDPEIAWCCEGSLKPVTASSRLNDRFIGASSGLFRSSANQTTAALEGVKTINLAVDAGDAINPQRLRHWRLEAEFFQSLGLSVRFAWWGQIAKAGNDIDEITPEELATIEYLTPKGFFKMADRELAKLTQEQRKQEGKTTDMDIDDETPQFVTTWETGLIWNKPERDRKGNIDFEPTPIGNHLEAIAYIETPDGRDAGLLVEFRTQRSIQRQFLLPRAALGRDASEIMSCLLERGYECKFDHRKQILKYLFELGAKVQRFYTVADKTGWVKGSFLTPAKTYGDPDLCFREPEPDLTLTHTKGTLDGWKAEVAAKCAGNSRLLFSLGCAFAAPVMPIAEIESGGFHLVGKTSIGKTTSLNISASVAGLKTIPNWRSTSNALEGKAAEFNHMLLPLDEIGQADPQTVGASAYMLGNGQGKSRMTKSLANVKPKTWQLMFLSTGEVGMVDYLRQAKISAKGGMEARMPSIPADAGKGFGAFEHLHGAKNAVEFVQELEQAIARQQGTALDAYLLHLVAARNTEGFDRELRNRVHAIARNLSKELNDNAIGRVAVRFALVQVGLETAHSFGLLPFGIEQCAWAVRQMFTDWLDVRGGAGSIEIKEACNKIQHLFVANQHNGDRVANAYNPQQVRNLLAYCHTDNNTEAMEFWVPPTIFNQELVDGVDKAELIKELQNRKWLIEGDRPDRHTNRRTLEKRQQSFFVFTNFWTCEKSTDLTDLTDYGDRNGADTGVWTSPNEVQLKNDHGLDGLNPTVTPDEQAHPTLVRDENSNGLKNPPPIEGSEIKSVKSVSENSNGLNRTTPETSPSNKSRIISPSSPSSPYKNSVSLNLDRIPKFKTGVHCTYSGKNPQIAKQYDGVLIVHEVNSINGITAMKPDGTLTSWIDPVDLKIA